MNLYQIIKIIPTTMHAPFLFLSDGDKITDASCNTYWSLDACEVDMLSHLGIRDVTLL